MNAAAETSSTASHAAATTRPAQEGGSVVASTAAVSSSAADTAEPAQQAGTTEVCSPRVASRGRIKCNLPLDRRLSSPPPPPPARELSGGAAPSGRTLGLNSSEHLFPSP